MPCARFLKLLSKGRTLIQANNLDDEVQINPAEANGQDKRKEYKKMAGNPSCKSTEHNMHICALKAEDFDKKNPEEFKQLTMDPKYKCANCGAMVKDSKNVCEPVEL